LKYQCFKNFKQHPEKGGDYWKNVNYDEHLKLTSHQTSYRYLLKQYPPPQKLLEAGCGIGRWVIPLLNNEYDVVGIDIEGEALNTVKKNHAAKNLALVQGDVFNMSFPDKTFDIVLSLGVLEHFEDPSIQKKAILEHVRVLKDKGIFLITVPHLSFVRFIFHIPFLKLVSLVHLLKRKSHYFSEYRYTKPEFGRILKNCQLNVIDIVYDDLLEPYNFGLTVDYPLRKLFRTSKIQYKANKFGNKVFKLMWRMHPKLVSGGIGFICQKSNE